MGINGEACVPPEWKGGTPATVGMGKRTFFYLGLFAQSPEYVLGASVGACRVPDHAELFPCPPLLINAVDRFPCTLLGMIQTCDAFAFPDNP